jgi:hypothetical protein
MPDASGAGQRERELETALREVVDIIKNRRADRRSALKVAEAALRSAGVLSPGQRERELEEALVEAVIPLEVLAGQDRTKPYVELSREFITQVERSIYAVRAALLAPRETREGG